MTEVLAPTDDDLKNPIFWRRKSKDLFFLCRFVLADAWPDKFNDFGPLQHEMCDFLMPAINPAKKKLLSCYRTSLKTTVLLGFVTWLFAWYYYKKEPTSINYNTATQDNASAFMDSFRYTLLNCPLLQAAFDLPSTEKGYDSFTKKQVRLGHVTFSVSSFDEQQASRHAKIIINDDVVNEQNYRLEAAREETKRKWRFQKSVSATIKKTDMNLEIDCGTAYHHDDLMWWLMTKNETYQKFIRAAVEGWPNVSIQDVLNQTRPLTDPTLMSYEILVEKLKDQERSIFSSQMLLKPLAEEDAFCLESWLRYYKALPWENEKASWRTFVIDPGGSIPGQHDASGFTILDCDSEKNLYVVYAAEKWLLPTALLKEIIDLKTEYKPDDTRVEKGMYSMTMADTITHRLPGLDVSFVEHKHRSKEDRIWGLRKLFEKGRIFLMGDGKGGVHESQRALFNQILDYHPPQDTKDDILDSLAYHLDIIRVPKETEKPRFVPNIEGTFDKEYGDYLAALEAKKAGDIDYDYVY
jgi:hypothetical protein